MEVINERAIRRLLFAFGIAAVLAVVLIALVVSLGWYFDPFNQQRFDVEAWAKADGYSRLSMVRDAMRRIQIGSTKSETIALLGPPDGELSAADASSHYCGPPPENTVETLSYYVGGNASGGPDSAFLWVHMDKDGRVIGSVIGGG